MKIATAIIICLLLTLAFLTGCNEPVASNVFPPALAGTWQADGSVWRIVLSKDGKVESAVVLMGQAEIKPNETTKFEMKDGRFSHITAGDCIAEYKPAGRELVVSIEQKDIYIPLPGNDVLAGNSVDVFSGPVSRDGKTWNARQLTVFDYGPRFPQDENDINNPQPLTFRKVEEPKKTSR
jgi:hypothetical protein